MQPFTKKPNLSELTLREKIGQTAIMQISLFMNRENLKEYLEENPIGNLWHTGNWCMNTTNLTGIAGGTLLDSEFYRKWCLGLRDLMKIPPFIGGDPVGTGFATNTRDLINAPAVAATNSEELAYRYGQMQARTAKSVGINHCYGTVVDIYSRFCSVGIMRALSDEPETLKKLSAAMIKGMQSEGVMDTIKHFPGSDAKEHRDYHFAPHIINMSLDEWKKTQGAVFQKMIDEGASSVMISHASFPAVDSHKDGATYRPSTISYNVITKLLKEDMGFDGVVITDSIDMGALVAACPDTNDLYVELLNAGNDLLINIKSYDYIDIIEKAVKDGRIAESRIDDACQRVLNMKEKIGLFDPQDEITYNGLAEEISEFNRTIAENSLTLECDITNRLPLDKSKIKNATIIYSGHSDGAYNALSGMKAAFERRGINAKLHRRLTSLDEIAEIDKESDLIIYAGYLRPHDPMGASSFYGDECATFFYSFTKGKEKSIGVSLCSVYVYYDFYANADTFVHAYNVTEETMEAFVKAIFGEIPFKGTMPYKAPGPEKWNF